MQIGVPKEIKTNENRVAVVPGGAEALVNAGHTVLIERGGGVGSGFEDGAYEAVGARIVASAGDVWAQSDMIMKVKEPIREEWPHMRRGQVVFTYFHFAADEALIDGVEELLAVDQKRQPVHRPVVGQREHKRDLHLTAARVHRLPRPTRRRLQPREPSAPRVGVAEQPLDIVEGGDRVLDRIVQQGGHDRGGVELHFRQDAGDKAGPGAHQHRADTALRH